MTMILTQRIGQGWFPIHQPLAILLLAFDRSLAILRFDHKYCVWCDQDVIDLRVSGMGFWIRQEDIVEISVFLWHLAKLHFYLVLSKVAYVRWIDSSMFSGWRRCLSCLVRGCGFSFKEFGQKQCMTPFRIFFRSLIKTSREDFILRVRQRYIEINPALPDLVKR